MVDPAGNKTWENHGKKTSWQRILQPKADDSQASQPAMAKFTTLQAEVEGGLYGESSTEGAMNKIH